MNIIGVQLVLVAFGFFMMYVLFLHFNKKDIRKKTFLVWMGIWSIFVLVALFPQTLEPLLINLFIVRVMDLGMIIAFMILSYLTFENNVRIKKHEEQIEKLVRKISIKKGTNEKK